LAKGRNIIIISGIVLAFIAGAITANPVVEAVGGWQLAIADLQSQIDEIPGTQVYEISAVSIILQGEDRGNEVRLQCLEGDWFLAPFSIGIITTEPSIVGEGIRLNTSSEQIIIGDLNSLSNFNKIIGFDVLPVITDIGSSVAPFDIDVTLTGLCVSPSP